jgi:hypothetical protein
MPAFSAAAMAKCVPFVGASRPRKLEYAFSSLDKAIARKIDSVANGAKLWHFLLLPLEVTDARFRQTAV